MALYFNLWDYYDPRYPFQFFIGGYATGKSYSAMKGAVEDGRPFIYMRRTETALEECTTNSSRGDMGNPFNPINDDTGWNIGLHKATKKTAGIYHRETDEDGLPSPKGAPIGMGVALPSLAKVRGAGLARHHLIIYDEFIKEKHERNMTGEFKALMRGYETINRNKEFQGLPPTILWMISNAEDIYNPIMVGMGIVHDVEVMIARGEQHRYWKDRGLAVHLLKSSEEFLAKKSETAVMKLMAGTQYAQVGLGNQFANNDFSDVRFRNIRGWRPLCCLDHAYIWQKKGEDRYYVSYAPATCMRYSAKSDIDERLFRQKVGIILQEKMMWGRVEYESYDLKAFMLEHVF